MHIFRGGSSKFTLLAAVLVTVLSNSQCLGQVNVTTWHNDNSRTGQNTSESALNTSNVNSTNFGRRAL
jgi:hypothetical protein